MVETYLLYWVTRKMRNLLQKILQYLEEKKTHDLAATTTPEN